MKFELIFKWVLIIVGIFLINYFPEVINNSGSGWVLCLGVILFVNGACWNVERRSLL